MSLVRLTDTVINKIRKGKRHVLFTNYSERTNYSRDTAFMVSKMNIEQSIYKEYWTYLNSNDKVTSEEIAESYYNFMKKTEFVKQFCDINKIKYREDLGQYYIYVKRKQYSANSKHLLIERLYTVFAKDALTLEKIYKYYQCAKWYL